jgi:hypothetical protein
MAAWRRYLSRNQKRDFHRSRRVFWVKEKKKSGKC